MFHDHRHVQLLQQDKSCILEVNYLNTLERQMGSCFQSFEQDCFRKAAILFNVLYPCKDADRFFLPVSRMSVQNLLKGGGRARYSEF